ncbi:hypothetical protein GJ744_006213 [Endocarpon pusillum]|uniref:Uncharacterized protein n=1 Tax=Endocarpon pusillum TaxID=364733 RepID=A0A8H7AP14_9EURO|nr:hypothetical protein GJ744_006213 [Endocarpon pusillum]
MQIRDPNRCPTQNRGLEDQMTRTTLLPASAKGTKPKNIPTQKGASYQSRSITPLESIEPARNRVKT